MGSHMAPWEGMSRKPVLQMVLRLERIIPIPARRNLGIATQHPLHTRTWLLAQHEACLPARHVLDGPHAHNCGAHACSKQTSR